jgi:deazaflavin-dependent oxidoreductase (nitroreductase family)
MILRVHRAVYHVSGGLVGHRLLGVPTLLLTTTGRRSGASQRANLVYVKDGGGYVVVASNGGADEAPGWFYNIEARPNVDVRVARRNFPAKARVVDKQDPTYARLWERVNEVNHRRYDMYQSRTTRQIPLVLLTATA